MQLLMNCTIGFSFSITGENKISDLCGTHKHLTDDVMYGYHGSHLTLDFRSNRIHSSGGFSWEWHVFFLSQQWPSRKLPTRIAMVYNVVHHLDIAAPTSRQCQQQMSFL